MPTARETLETLVPTGIRSALPPDRLRLSVALVATLLLGCFALGGMFGGSSAAGEPDPSLPPSAAAALPSEKPVPSKPPLPETPPPETRPPETPEPVLTPEEMLEIIESDPAYPENLVEFARKYSQVIEYVYLYPEKKDLTYDIDLSAEAGGDSVPLLLQWDERWGYEPYGRSGQIGDAGCGPVCMSMVALYLTGDPQWTPVAVAQVAVEKGYRVLGNGTSWSFFHTGCEYLGLRSKVLSLSENAMKSALDMGHPIILSMKPGDFTYSGHFIVVSGYNETGFTVCDPNSVENSEKTWTFDQLKGQIRNLWAFSA